MLENEREKYQEYAPNNPPALEEAAVEYWRKEEKISHQLEKKSIIDNQ